MVIGLGTDIVDMERIESLARRFGERFAGHILHPDELEEWRKSRRSTFLAGRFAAKEALVKAIGTGFSRGIRMSDILVGRGAAGEPAISLSGRALEHFLEKGGETIHVSISHGRRSAIAVVIIEGIRT